MIFPTDQRPPPADCMTMAQVRQGVDALDRLLVSVLAERQRYMDAAARIKPDRGAVRDAARIEDVVAKVKAAAREAGPSQQLPQPLWPTLIDPRIAHQPPLC